MLKARLLQAEDASLHGVHHGAAGEQHQQQTDGRQIRVKKGPEAFPTKTSAYLNQDIWNQVSPPIKRNFGTGGFKEIIWCWLKTGAESQLS